MCGARDAERDAAMTHDVAILGSGFAGSILAWILARQGMRVVILDRDRHPRFAIGESSTPLADMALLRIAAKHGIGDLAALARYGTWLKACPEVRDPAGARAAVGDLRAHAIARLSRRPTPSRRRRHENLPR